MAVPTNMKFYRYLIDSFDILLPGATPIKVDPKQINAISIEKDFDGDYFPVLRIDLSVTQAIYYQILKYKIWVKFRIRMQKYVYNSIKEFQFKKDVFNDIFCTFIDDGTPFMNKDEHDASKQTDRTTITPRDMNQEISLYLFKEDDVLNSKKIFNTIIKEASMTDMVTYCLSATGFSNILMAPFDNKTTYNQVLLPPLTTLGNLLYLDEHYGFYDRGSLIFFDIDCTYIIDRNPKCTAWRRQEYTQTVFSIKSSTNADQFSPGCVVNDSEKKYYLNITPGAINMYNDSVTNDQINGNSLITITPSSGIVKTFNNNVAQRGGGTYKILVNKYNNDYANNAETYRLKENGNIVHVNIGDFDIDALTPNKEFMFTFEDTKVNMEYGGNYRITKIVFTFTKSGEEFIISGNAEFKKV